MDPAVLPGLRLLRFLGIHRGIRGFGCLNGGSSSKGKIRLRWGAEQA
jgi:hypothetical protein